MTTANISLHSQRSSNPGATEESTGQVYAGVDVDSPLNSALRFAPPADIAGATITSVTLTIRAKYSETTGGVLCKFALADNTSNLAAQNLASTAETNHDYLHTQTYTGLATPPAGSVEITSTYASYSIDLTATADVANLEDDVIVLCQYEAFQRFTGSDDTAHITFDGIGDTTPASLEIVYTPAATTLNHESTDDDDVTVATASVELIAVSETTDADDTSSATTSVLVVTSLDSTDADDTSTATTSVLVVASLSTTDADDTSSATASSEMSASSTTTDADDTSLATVSVTASAAHSSTDADDTTLATAEGFGWIADSETTDSDDTTLATVALTVSAVSETTDADDVTLSTASLSSLSASLNSTDADDVTLATVSIVATASLATTDADDVTLATATRNITQRRGFVPRQFRSSNHFQKSIFLGV